MSVSVNILNSSDLFSRYSASAIFQALCWALVVHREQCPQRVHDLLGEEFQLTRSCELDGKYYVEECMVCYETTKEEPLPSGKGRNFMAGFPNKDTLFTQGKSKEVCRKDKWRGEFL